jgi:antitoxin component YwqK of YwqJK toxin-antitoxin module
MRYAVVAVILVCGAAAVASIVSDTPAEVRVTRYDSGEIASESQYDSAGRLHGRLTGYHRDGTIASETIYSHGVMVSHRLYNSDGSVSTQ